jgi:hypothetical protein
MFFCGDKRGDRCGFIDFTCKLRCLSCARLSWTQLIWSCCSWSAAATAPNAGPNTVQHIEAFTGNDFMTGDLSNAHSLTRGCQLLLQQQQQQEQQQQWQEQQQRQQQQ